ncbi:MAG TPA: hypothetical protein VL283_00435 [Candidatus Baltobacteraceae bacterium]|nr:hypothetical protein [Candidatus Baltobacteraceae bacterium]
MASRNASRGRKAPFRRRRNRFLFRGRWWKIVYFDGYALRHMQPDVDIMLWHGDGNNEFVPPRQLWLDRRYRAETKFQLEVFQIEKMKKWTKKGDNERYPPYKALRDYLKEKLCRKAPIPEFIDREEWNAEHQVNIVYVRGDIVRKYLDPHFVFGGHDLVYPTYITTPKTIWVDVCQDPREIKYTLIHETHERKLMELGWRYGSAHASAIRAELKLRAQEYVNVDKEEEMGRLKPLKVEPIEQSDTGCFPTSWLMLLEYDGIKKPDGSPYTEEELIALCACDPEAGTDHAPGVEGMRRISGVRVVTGENATLEDLKRIVLEERRPVLIGWWNGPHRTREEVLADPDLDEGHFSVVTHVSRSHVHISNPWIIDPEADEEDEDDPGGAPGVEKRRIKDFVERWYDMDGSPTETDPGYHVVRGWYVYLRAPDGSEPKP